MAGRALICKECKKPARDEAPECRYCGAPLPRSAVSKCATCAGTVGQTDAPCSHCGAPIAGVRAPGAQLLRCAACSSQVSTDAKVCPRCKAVAPGDTAVLPQLSAERRAAEDGPTEAVAAALSGTATGLAADVARSEVALNRSLEQGVRAQITAAEQRELARSGPAKGPPQPCRVCGRPNPPDAYLCPHCGIGLRAQPAAAPAGPVRGAVPPWVKPTAVVVGLASLFALGQWWRIHSDGRERDSRLRASLGPAATDKDLEALKKRADAMGVRPEALVVVSRRCFLHPDRTPSETDMANAVADVERGDKRSARLVEFVTRRCREP